MVEQGPQDPSRRRFIRNIGQVLFWGGSAAALGSGTDLVFQLRKEDAAANKERERYVSPHNADEVRNAQSQAAQFKKKVEELTFDGKRSEIPRVAADPDFVESFQVLDEQDAYYRRGNFNLTARHGLGVAGVGLGAIAFASGSFVLSHLDRSVLNRGQVQDSDSSGE